ncbi:MAG: DUF1573 domain-containing protein [Bacteroidales bacterium]
MFRRLFFPLFIVGVLGFCSCSSSSTKSQENIVESDSSAVADLEYIEDFFDFGTITAGETVSHTFRFKNSGNGVLIVKDVIPSCGCTTSKLSSKMLKPGDEGTVEVVFNSTGWYGSQYKSVTLRTNSPIREKSVTIKANVVEGSN